MKSEDITKICLAAVAISFLLTLASCQQSAEEIQAEAALVEAETKQLKVEEDAETAREKERLNRVQQLIEDQKVTAFAARCAVYGPSAETSNHQFEICAKASGVKLEE